MEKKEYKNKKHILKSKYHEDKRAIKGAYKDAKADLRKIYKEYDEEPEEEKEEKVPLHKKSREYKEYMAALNVEKRKENHLPFYTHGEEIMNMVTHIVGGGTGIIGLAVGFVFAMIKHSEEPLVAISMLVFTITMILLYTVSAVYHGLHVNKGKKVFQIIDHCTIYLLIAGTYTPICTLGLASINPWNYVLLGIVWALCIFGIVINATMMKKMWVKVISMILYIATGWAIIFFYPVLVQSMTVSGMWLFIGGGISYTVGSILYGIGSKKRYFHSIFHLFVNLGTLLQYLAILLYLVINIQA